MHDMSRLMMDLILEIYACMYVCIYMYVYIYIYQSGCVRVHARGAKCSRILIDFNQNDSHV